MHLLNTPHAGGYRVIYADPAWKFATYGPEAKNAKGAGRHYETSSLGTMGRLPVGAVAAPDAWLLMWVTWPHLPQAFELASAWSDPANPWTYRTGGAWAKRPRGWKGARDTWAFGTGYIFRSASEVLLVFGRGRPTWHSKAERNLWVDVVRRHSEKPEQVRDMIRRATDGPRLEMFARGRFDGFDSWGPEVDG